jgi:hypothetical protein
MYVPPESDPRLSANWPSVEELTEFAELIGAEPRLPMTAREALLCMAEVSPPSIAAELRARARALALPISPRLAAMYEEHADGLTQIEALYTRPLPRT